jgi:hypothetical protein
MNTDIRSNVRKLMKAFLADPSITNAQALEVALDPLTAKDVEGSSTFDDLAGMLAQYRPEGGDHLYSSADLTPIVERALARLGPG